MLERFLHAARKRRQHEHRFDALVIHHCDTCITVLVLGVLREPLDLHQRRRVDAFGNLAAEQQIQAPRLDDRVECRVGDEAVDPVPDDCLGVLAVAEHLNATSAELLVQVPGKGVHRLVIMVVDVDRLIAQVPHHHPFR